MSAQTSSAPQEGDSLTAQAAGPPPAPKGSFGLRSSGPVGLGLFFCIAGLHVRYFVLRNRSSRIPASPALPSNRRGLYRPGTR